MYYVAQVPFQGRENDVKHFLTFNGVDFVLTYEDKDGDWMMVGDVPWRYSEKSFEQFI